MFEESRAQAEAFAGKGYDLCKYGKYADALDLFRQASELDPSNFKYWYNAAVACDRVGDDIGMEQASQKTIECDGTFIKGYLRLAKALVRQHKYDSAAEIIATGLLIDETHKELLELKTVVVQKQEERSLVEARRLAEQLQRQQKEMEKINIPPPPPAPPASSAAATTTNLRSSTSTLSGTSALGMSAVTTVGGNIAKSTAGGGPRTGGIPAGQRELPKLNNPYFADSGPRSPPQQPRHTTNPYSSSSPPQQQREIPRFNQPHFGDNTASTTSPRPPPRLARPYSRPQVPPNRANGPDYKDQCATFILVDPNAVQELPDPTTTTTEQARVAAPAVVPTKPQAHPMPQKPQRSTGRGGGGGFFSSSRRSVNNNHNHSNNNINNHDVNGRNVEF
jgi:hypothetical protein